MQGAFIIRSAEGPATFACRSCPGVTVNKNDIVDVLLALEESAQSEEKQT